MNNYKNIMVMGAGAVGGYFGGRIAQNADRSVTLIARGAHLEAMKQHGLKIESVDGDAVIPVNAFEDPVQASRPDLILFTVKSHDTPAAIDQIKGVVGTETRILTIQNGIENYPQLVGAFGKERVIQGFCKIGAGISEPGVIHHRAFGEITIGEPGSKQPSDRLKMMQDLGERAGIPVHIAEDIERAVWLKFSWNCVLNMITVIANVTVEKLFAFPETEALCYRVFGEIQTVAEAEGVDMKEEDAQKVLGPARALEGFETSTYQDRQKGKPLEYEAFTGAIIRLAEKQGIAIPANRTLYALLKLLDNEG